MRRYLLIIILFLLLIPSSFAQKLKVESFAISEGDLSAVTPARLDENDRNCALIKVGIALDGVQFEGNVMGNVIPKLGGILGVYATRFETNESAYSKFSSCNGDFR